MRQSKKKRSLVSHVFTALMVGILLLVLGSTVFSGLFAVRSIEVRGNTICSDEEVITASGISLGQSIFSVKAKDVQRGINANRYLEYVSVRHNFFPCSVILTVDEHSPVAKMSWLGMLMLIGDDGVVMESTSSIDITVHVPEIVGMTVQQGTAVGHPVVYGVPGQGEAIQSILDALREQGLLTSIVQINISTPDNIALVTDRGLQVLLGEAYRIPEKIEVLRNVLPRVYERDGVSGGVMHISNDISADFLPGAANQ